MIGVNVKSYVLPQRMYLDTTDPLDHNGSARRNLLDPSDIVPAKIGIDIRELSSARRCRTRLSLGVL
jgi:hypothetical protein